MVTLQILVLPFLVRVRVPQLFFFSFLCAFVGMTNIHIICLGYGVMVTLQILVLPFLVRVRVPQHEKRFCLVRAKSLFRLYIR